MPRSRSTEITTSRAAAYRSPAGKVIEEAYRKVVDAGAWERIFAKLVELAKGGDTKAIEMLCKLGGHATPPTKATQIVNHYYGPKGKKGAAQARGAMRPALAATSNGNGRGGLDEAVELADRIAERLELHAPQSDTALAEDLGVDKRAVSAVCKIHRERFRQAGSRGTDNLWALMQED